MLNVESGLNDGLALPAVVVLLAVATRQPLHIGRVLTELLGGTALGLLLPLAAHALSRLPGLGAEPRLQPLGPFAVAVLLYATCHLVHANHYLAAFTAGSTLATVAPSAERAFEQFGELISQLTKFAALLAFGTLLTPALIGRVTLGGYVVAVLALLLVRPAALLVSLIGSPLPFRERATAAWFGPKGFASVVYGLLVVQSGLAAAARAFDLVAVTIAVSIAAHSSTDVPVARLFRVDEAPTAPSERPPGGQRRA
jgi:NhaP-type Na+/H+ or K+/H+ antiporter